MILLDVNILICAHNETAEQHATDRAWLQQTLGGATQVGLPLVTALGFVRIITNPRALDPAVPVPAALRMLAAVRAAPAVVPVDPIDGHWERVAELAAETRLSGPELTDVHLAVLAIERGASLATHDRGFRRFPHLRLIDPSG